MNIINNLHATIINHVTSHQKSHPENNGKAAIQFHGFDLKYYLRFNLMFQSVWKVIKENAF